MAARYHAQHAAKPYVSRRAAAITVALSAFVGTMSIIVAIISASLVGRQDSPKPNAPSIEWTNSGASSLAFAIAVLLAVNAAVAFRSARLRPWITAACTAFFVIATLFVNLLFVRVW